MIKHRGQWPANLQRDGRKIKMLFHKGHRVYPLQRTETLPPLGVRTVLDATGNWLEIGFKSADLLTGNASAGWTNPLGITMVIQQSTDLQTWALGKFGDCAGSPQNMGDGTYDYWSRGVIPSFWQSTMVDLTATSDLQGKSITSITVMRAPPLALPAYPYAMPAQLALLCSHLQAAGYPAAEVSSSPSALVATIRNHTNGAIYTLPVTMDGTSVSVVKTSQGVTIALPGYPYAMPAAQAALQADLRTAGHTGAVVMLHADIWIVRLRGVLAAGPLRELLLTITPADPNPQWDRFGTQTVNPGNSVAGTPGNVRTPAGLPLLEESKQFARLAISLP